MTRTIVFAAAVAAFGASAGAQEATLHAFLKANHHCVGSWDTIHTPEPGGPPPFNSLFTIHADGTVVESDDGPPTPQLFTAGHGAWEPSKGNRDCLLSFRQIYFDENANLQGLLKVSVRFTVNKQRTAISGKSIVYFYDAQGNFLFSGLGTIAGSAIKPEPF